VPELRVHDPRRVPDGPPSIKLTEPVVVSGDMVAVSVTLAPKVAVVMAVAGAEVSAAFSVAVVVAFVTEKLMSGVELSLLAVKLATFVGVNTAVRDSVPTGNAMVGKAADPAVTVTAEPSEVLLL